MLRAVLDHGPVARSNVARLTGISTASVSGISAALLDVGLIREAPEAAGPPGFGRPHVPLDLECDANVVLGVHVAIPKATVAVVDLRGRVLSSRSLPHDRPDPADAIAAVARAARELCAEHADRRVHGIGTAIGGWVDEATGTIVENAMLDWHDVPLTQMLEAATGLPTYVENHGRALLRAEQLLGRHVDRARESIVHLFVGHVVDGAFSTQGHVHRGRHSAAGHLAHLPVDADPATDPTTDPATDPTTDPTTDPSTDPATDPASTTPTTNPITTGSCECGHSACLQAAASDHVLLRRAAELGIRARYVTDLVDLVRSGEQRLVPLFVERSRVVAQAVAHLVDLFSPEVLVLTEAGFIWVPEAREALYAEVAARSRTLRHPAEVVVAPSCEDFLAMAGAGVLLDRIFAAPLEVVGRLPSAS
ncbi:ROK family transcriptional regulator [Nocardioides sp. AN3]